MQIWLINPFDPVPGEALRPGRYAFLSKTLAASGHHVTWLTSDFSHTAKEYRAQPGRDVDPTGKLRVVMLHTPAYHRNVGVKRIWNHLVYSRRVNDWASCEPSAPDLILASSPPLSSATGAVHLAKEMGCRSVVDIQDLWPQFFTMLLPRPLRNLGDVLLRPAVRYYAREYLRADGIVAVCDAYLRGALQPAPGDPAPRALVLHLGVDLAAFDHCARFAASDSTLRTDGRLKVAYLGTVGAATDVSTILESASLLRRSQTPVTIFIAGTGPQLPSLQEAAAGRQLDNLVFAGFLPFEPMVRLLLQCDLGLNPRVPGLPDGTFPNKVFDYMAAGLPIVNSVGGELAQLVASQGIGRQYQAGSAESLVEALVDLQEHPRLRRDMGRRSRLLAEERFDRNRSYGRYADFLEQITAARGEGDRAI